MPLGPRGSALWNEAFKRPPSWPDTLSGLKLLYHNVTLVISLSVPDQYGLFMDAAHVERTTSHWMKGCYYGRLRPGRDSGMNAGRRWDCWPPCLALNFGTLHSFPVLRATWPWNMSSSKCPKSEYLIRNGMYNVKYQNCESFKATCEHQIGEIPRT